MTLREALGLAGFLAACAGLIYHAGRTAEQFERLQQQAKIWADGLGNLERTNSARSERRWLFQIASDIERSETGKDKKLLADEVRQEAYRK